MNINNGHNIFYTCYNSYFIREYIEFVFRKFEDLHNFIADITNDQIIFNNPDLVLDSDAFKRNEQANVVVASSSLFSHHGNYRMFDICNTDSRLWFDSVRVTIKIDTPYYQKDDEILQYSYTVRICNSFGSEYNYDQCTEDTDLYGLKSSLYGICLAKAFIYNVVVLHDSENSLFVFVEDLMTNIQEQLDKEYVLKFKNISEVNKWLSELTTNDGPIPELNLITRIVVNNDKFNLSITNLNTNGAYVKIINQNDLNHPKIKNLFYHALFHGAELI